MRQRILGTTFRKAVLLRNEWNSKAFANQIMSRSEDLVILFTRLSLGLAFLSAVADRFGVWGTRGTKSVVWGDWTHFAHYTSVLTSALPVWTTPWLAWIATIAETVFGVLLVIGFRVRLTATLSGILLVFFGIAMAVAIGPEAPFSASVFSAAAASWLLCFRNAHGSRSMAEQF